MDSSRTRAQQRLVLVLDGLIVAAAMALAVQLHGLLRPALGLLQVPPTSDQLVVLPFLVLPTFLVLLTGLGLHRLFEEHWPARRLLAGLVALHAAAFVLVAVLIYLTQAVLNRSLTLLFLGCSFLLLWAERALLLRWHRARHREGAARQRVLLVGGDTPELRRFAEESQQAPVPPLVVGWLGLPGPASAAPARGPAPLLGGYDALQEVLHREVVDLVLFFPPLHRPDAMVRALDACEALGIPAHFAVELPRPSLASPRVSTLLGRPFVTFELSPKPPLALAVKHVLDVLGALVALALAAPVMLAAALAILVTMGRPVFFVQDRVGLFGRRFRMLKFRTMERDAERRRDALQAQNELSGPVFKITRDPRVTPLGRLLRQTSVDELPQLFNVLTGAMSLVGPRPLPVREQDAIQGWFRRRCSMRPGITGLWQVSGRSDVDFEQWMRLDLEYVDHWSLGLDLRILLRTLPTVLEARGAR